MFRAKYGFVPTASHHFMNSSVPNSLLSTVNQASSCLFRCQCCYFKCTVLNIVKEYSLPSPAISQHGDGVCACGGNRHVNVLFGPFLPRANTVYPMIRRYKVATWVSHDRAVELLDGFNNIFTEAVFIGQGISRIIDASVDATADVPCTMSNELFASLGRMATHSVKPP